MRVSETPKTWAEYRPEDRPVHEGHHPDQRDLRADRARRRSADRPAGSVRAHRRLRLSLHLVRHAYAVLPAIPRRMGADDV